MKPQCIAAFINSKIVSTHLFEKRNVFLISVSNTLNKNSKFLKINFLEKGNAKQTKFGIFYAITLAYKGKRL